MTTAPVWLSCHVFYHDDADRLLTELLLPMLAELRRRGLTQRQFYLRHWERGPHVRVRTRTLPAHRDQVRAEIERRVTEYLAEHPGATDTDQGRLATALHRLNELEHGVGTDVLEAEPPNTLRWIEYRPELAKYGGPRGVAVAEDVFDTSTLLAGEVVQRVGEGRARLGVAMQFLLLASRALGLTEAQRPVFFRHYHERWRSYVPDPALIGAWAHQYDAQRDTYRRMLGDLERGRPLGRGLGRRWEDLIADAVGRLRPLVERREVWPAEVEPSAPPFVALAALVSQYLHTTNNRMNVRPQGECFVAYLAHRAATDRGADVPELSGLAAGTGAE
ncbi:lantibiotic dehydratase C-terminal domain-containing protein [Micromonospora sp. WMMD956]|uniref:lantibiotic dehydratase C-terminal domain-containing protein n=1 Tax=Micromonospora sp. WMMD956 TaxID=3016108 RepID=UPI002417031A|nr:lantibiotic dehydratase C-terminal domain-containing protein [Micromonospora sp. WMMD956]MDG4816754.1 lantibiotic dehydratase C-terminal domain-containing protein [Micromonospora sp. WMMD956]